jgi:3-methyladenine DNA glycosylase AlkD
MLYEQLLQELKDNGKPDLSQFNKRILGDPAANVLGVSIPAMRKIAKKHFNERNDIMAFPNYYYEVKFVKLCIAAMLPYDEYVGALDGCVDIIDNWSLCDSFNAKCIDGHKQDYLSYIDKYLAVDSEFYQRFALTNLLQHYVEEDSLNKIYDSVLKADTSYYYVHMAAAWLVAEVLAKFYQSGVNFLVQAKLDIKTHNKAIQKARESLRLSDEQKNFLKGLKR